MTTSTTVRLPRLEAKSAEGKNSSPPPEHVLKLIKLALDDYLTRDDWARVRKAILSPCDSKPESEPEQDRFLSTEAICELLHVSRVTIHRYKVAGKIRAYKLGRRNLYSVAEIMAALKGDVTNE